jgi:hypothetical protein
MNASIKVLVAGSNMKVGKYPGLIAVKASSVALKNTENAINIGFTEAPF